MIRCVLLVSAATLALGGCATSPDVQELRDEPGFQAGYGDGCTTAVEDSKSFSTRRERDAYAFENDRAYRAGWRQGYFECDEHIPDLNDGGRILGERNEY